MSTAFLALGRGFTENFGIDVSVFDEGSVLRTVDKRRQVEGAPTVGDSAARVLAARGEAETVLASRYVGHSAFFRNALMWATLARSVLPSMFDARALQKAFEEVLDAPA